MRSLTAAVAGIVATLAALAAVPLLWISTHVADDDGYVALSSELATDPELQKAFAAYLADDLVQRGALPGSLQDLATSALTSAARTTTKQPGFTEAWEETQSSLHASAFGKDASGPITVDVAPFANFVVDRIGDQLPVSLSVGSKIDVPLGTAQDRERLSWIGESPTWSRAALAIALLGAVVCVLAARSRALALAGLGVGAMVVAGTLWLVTSILSPRLVDETSSASEFGRRLQRLLVDRAGDSLVGWLEPIAMVGFAAALLGLPRTSSPDATAGRARTAGGRRAAGTRCARP